MILSPEIWSDVRKVLAPMEQPVQLIHFSATSECEFCQESRELLEELAALSDKLRLETCSLQDEEVAFRYLVNKAPATVVTGSRNFGICFYGFPFGFEFASLLDVLVAASTGELHLHQETLSFLDALEQPLHLQTFVTPGCHHCPAMVMLANRLALASENVMADTVEAMEFPKLVAQYGVRGVPHIVVNETRNIVGAMQEREFVSRLTAMLSMA